MNVLIAEDDAVSRGVLVSILKALGHEVHAAENGQEAWDMFLVGPPRVVLTDWMMPQMDGPELCRKIRSSQRISYTYIILVTALGEKGFYVEGMEAGADDFVTKPFKREEMAARLKVAERILGLQEEVSRLKGLLPICAYCKRIRDENSIWHALEAYVEERIDASFTPALCPDCAQENVVAPLPHGAGNRR